MRFVKSRTLDIGGSPLSSLPHPLPFPPLPPALNATSSTNSTTTTNHDFTRISGNNLSEKSLIGWCSSDFRRTHLNQTYGRSFPTIYSPANSFSPYALPLLLSRLSFRQQTPTVSTNLLFFRIHLFLNGHASTPVLPLSIDIYCHRRRSCANRRVDCPSD